MRFFKLLLALGAVFYLSGCASSYPGIQPENLSYNSKNIAEDGITMGYRYDLLPKKYAKKEKKEDIRLVAVKLKNNTNKELVFGQDYKLVFEGGNNVTVLSKDKVFSELKQKGAFHLLYLLLTPVTLNKTTNDGNGSVTTESIFPIGLIIGPGIAALNLIKASSSNKRFEKELYKYNLNNESLKPGEEKFGIIGIRSDSYDALSINFIGNIDVEEDNDTSVE